MSDLNSQLSNAVRAEIATAISANEGQLGKVFALLQSGKTKNRELVDGGAAANSGSAANSRATVQAILKGVIPTGASVAAQAGRSIGGLLRDNPDLSIEAKAYLSDLRSELDSKSASADAISEEASDLNQASISVQKRAEDLSGVYVYTLPTYFRTVQMTSPDRFLFKIGKTDRFAGARINEQQRLTGLPEDPIILRVYRSDTQSPAEIEAKFHRFLDAAGHARSTTKTGGREWFNTNLEFLDTIAKELGLEIVESPIPEI